jgi:hypothetical protein
MSFDPISAGIEFAGKVVDRIWPDATEKQKAEAAQAVAELAHQENIFSKEVEDRASARQRESDVASSEVAPKINKVVTPVLALGTVAIALFLFGVVLFQTGLIDASRKDLAIYILGALTTAVTQILSYYFGSSSGSTQKTSALEQLIKK